MNYYAQAIGILTEGTLDARALAIRLAQRNPKLFVELAAVPDSAPASAPAPIPCADNFPASPLPPMTLALDAEKELMAECENQLRDGVSKITTIKWLRSRSGLGLKDAMAFVNRAEDRIKRS